MPTTRRAELLQKISRPGNFHFEETALELFRFQAAGNSIFKKWLAGMGCNPLKISDLTAIPFLPISFFKTHEVKTGRWKTDRYFTSSSTTGQVPSRHAVRDFGFYRENAMKGFEFNRLNTMNKTEPVFEAVSDWIILALLPGYLERSGSSLVAMADFFIQKTGRAESGFYLNEFEKLSAVLQKCQAENRPTLLLGVSFALLDFAEFAEKHDLDFSKITVMETGGMKGRRREMTRPELHKILRNSLKINAVHSEYGMTELFSQAYSVGKNSADPTAFQPAATLRAFAKEIQDPLASQPAGRAGQLCFIDLANVDSCGFIASEDVGRVFENGHFEVLGRLDAAEMRGCNLMVE